MSTTMAYSGMDQPYHLTPSELHQATYLDNSQPLAIGHSTPPRYTVQPIPAPASDLGHGSSPPQLSLSPGHIHPVNIVPNPPREVSQIIFADDNGLAVGLGQTSTYRPSAELGDQSISSLSRSHSPPEQTIPAAVDVKFQPGSLLAASVGERINHSQAVPTGLPGSFLIQSTPLSSKAAPYHHSQTQPTNIDPNQYMRVTYPYSSARSTGSTSSAMDPGLARSVGQEKQGSNNVGNGTALSSSGHGSGHMSIREHSVLGGGYKHTQFGVNRGNLMMALTGQAGQAIQTIPDGSYSGLKQEVAEFEGKGPTSISSGQMLSGERHYESSPDPSRLNSSIPGLGASVPVPIHISTPTVPGIGGNWDMRPSALPGLIHSAGTATSVSTSAATPVAVSTGTTQTPYHLHQILPDGVREGSTATSSTSNFSLPGIASMSFNDSTFGKYHSVPRQSQFLQGPVFTMPTVQPLQVSYQTSAYDRPGTGIPRSATSGLRKGLQTKMGSMSASPQTDYTVPTTYPQQYQVIQPSRPVAYGNKEDATDGYYAHAYNPSHGMVPGTQLTPVYQPSNQPLVVPGFSMIHGADPHHFILAPTNQQAYSKPTFFVQHEQLQPGRYEGPQQTDSFGGLHLQSMPPGSQDAGYDTDGMEEKGGSEGPAARDERSYRGRSYVSQPMPVEEMKPTVRIVTPVPLEDRLSESVPAEKDRRSKRTGLMIQAIKLKKSGRKLSSPRNHFCPQCEKGFNRPSSLRTHMTVHTLEKPHQCSRSGCMRYFSVLSNLRRHERTHDRKAAESQAALRSAARGGSTSKLAFEDDVDQGGEIQMVDEDDKADDTPYRPTKHSRRNPKRSSSPISRHRSRKHRKISGQQHRHRSEACVTPPAPHIYVSGQGYPAEAIPVVHNLSRGPAGHQAGEMESIMLPASSILGSFTYMQDVHLPRPDLMRAEQERASPLPAYFSPSPGILTGINTLGSGNGQTHRFQTPHNFHLPPIQTGGNLKA